MATERERPTIRRRVVEVDFSLDDAKALMRHLQTLGNFDEFTDDREPDRLNEDAAFQIRDFVRDHIVVRGFGPAPRPRGERDGKAR